MAVSENNSEQATLCDCLVHPFQQDAGMSQPRRVMQELLDSKASADGRKMADLLDYISQLSPHITYYDTQLNTGDWKPFFQKSIPFVLASLIRYDSKAIRDNAEMYSTLFNRKPTAAGLQLLQQYTFYRIIKPLNNWYSLLQKTGLPVERVFENILKDKLRQPLLDFDSMNRLATRWYGLPGISFAGYFKSESGELPVSVCVDKKQAEEGDLYQGTDCERLEKLYKKIKAIFISLLEPIRILSGAAEQSLEQSFVPLKEELRQKHLPQLGLLFAFLKLFQLLQADLNGFTKKHLDFFYKQVLRLQPREAVPDKVNLVFAIQKELNSYLLDKGLLTKDGKDLNKEEILFALDDEIVVNQAQVKEIRTLHLKNQVVPESNPATSTQNQVLLEGIYAASDATKADGVDKEFQTDVKNYYTLGNKSSKYLLPSIATFKPYPSARIGFVLASPVLLLNEGKRTVTLTLDCSFDTTICQDMASASFPQPAACCGTLQLPANIPSPSPQYPFFLPTEELFAKVSQALDTPYYYINEEILAELTKKGVNVKLAEKIRKTFLLQSNETGDLEKPYCYCPTEIKKYESIIATDEWENLRLDTDISEPEMLILDELVPQRKPLALYFSGEKGWITPNKDNPVTFEINPGSSSSVFSLVITAVLTPELDAVTFYNKETLLEGFDTSMPLVKVELDDKLKLYVDSSDIDPDCCLTKMPEFEKDRIPVSLYHFFRHVRVGIESKIHVEVCGVKKLVVQNDESLMDVNGPVYPFGSRPKVIDFDPKRIPKDCGTSSAENCEQNLVGPNFYIGSQEVFCKKWEQVYINLDWKDRPVDFRDYYKAYWVNEISGEYGLDESRFEINLAILEEGDWIKEEAHPSITRHNMVTEDENRELFATASPAGYCGENKFQQTILLDQTAAPAYFDLEQKFNIKKEIIDHFDVSSRYGFMRMNLQNQDFMHKDYSFILARQMMAFGRYPSLVDGAVYLDAGTPQVFDISVFFGNVGPRVLDLARQIVDGAITNILDDLLIILQDSIDSSAEPDAETTALLNGVMSACRTLLVNVLSLANIANPFDSTALTPAERISARDDVRDFVTNLFGVLNTNLDGIEDELKAAIKDKFEDIIDTIDLGSAGGFFSGLFDSKEVPIPNEPWTPVISAISIDYTATATAGDIEYIHLYPYANTHKKEELQLNPPIFAIFCDEGTLYLGLEKLVPGNNLNILFQLADATADSETGKEDVFWYYLDNNLWKPLRKGFEILEDGTLHLTATGIIKFALPENMTKDNTIMPAGLHWIKAAIPENSASVSETTGIHAQAMSATFTNTPANDKLRLGKPIEAGQVAKLETADAAVKEVAQPYESFAGAVPEEEGMYYVRVSELLRHKGRAIQKFDYERIVLNAYPEIFKAKCINHSFGLNAHAYKNDFPYAPGYIIMAVIPDLTKLKAGNAFEPKVPASLLEKIDQHIRKRSSPFVRFRTMNPRYEKIHLCLKVKLQKGKDENYYKEKLKEDIRTFFAPWAIGKDYNKLRFGQCVYRADIIGFMESLDYIDFILALNMRHESETVYKLELDVNGKPVEKLVICPKTPRSILIAGDLDVCIDPAACESWESNTSCGNKPKNITECKPAGQID